MKKLIIIAIVLLVGCSSLPKNWRHATNDPATSRNDFNQCVMYARQMGLMAASGSANPMTRGALQGMEQNRSFVECMESKGYLGVDW